MVFIYAYNTGTYLSRSRNPQRKVLTVRAAVFVFYGITGLPSKCEENADVWVPLPEIPIQ